MVSALQRTAESVATARERPPVPAVTHRRVLTLAGVLTAATLVLTASVQFYDSNLYVMGEATALLAGDRPGRDFFWWGTPLEAYAAAAAQLASGGRLIGEFLRQWLYIIAGVVIAFHLGLRLSRSAGAVLVMLAPTLVVVANTPTYHASKLLFFPLFLWVAWRYVDNPSAKRAAVLAVVSALGFLTRHDYGIYLGLGSIVALVTCRVVVHASRRLPSLVRDGAIYAGAVAVLVAPWAASVHTTEGLAEYTRARFALYALDAPDRTPYASLLDVNPLRLLRPAQLPPPAPGVVRFLWHSDVDDDRQQELEEQYGLSLLEERDSEDRPRYEVRNIYDFELLELDRYIRAPAGFEFDRLLEARARLPARTDANLWLRHVALTIPLVLIAAGGLALWRYRTGDRTSSADAAHMIVAGAFLVFVNSALFRELGYVVVTAPLSAALSARFLVGSAAVGRAIAIVVLMLTTFAVVVWGRHAPIFLPSEVPASVSGAFARLLASPAVEAEPKYRYVYECTAPGDRLLITGDMPGMVSYYANRPMAGGHTMWDHGWRSTPAQEAHSLEMLKGQAVPFAISTHDPVLNDFQKYPRIHEYLEQHYDSLDGTHGTILVDTRRQPTGRYGPLGYPCFN